MNGTHLDAAMIDSAAFSEDTASFAVACVSAAAFAAADVVDFVELAAVVAVVVVAAAIDIVFPEVSSDVPQPSSSCL